MNSMNEDNPPTMKKPGSRVAASPLDDRQAGPPRADEMGSGDAWPAGVQSPAELDWPSPSYQRSNAFFVMRERGEGLNRLPRKSSGNLSPASDHEQSTPGMARKYSGLDYDGELALPMPKPRVRGENVGDERSAQSTGIPRPSSHPRLLKKRSMPESALAGAAEVVTSADGKKPTRLEALKSKLSFKDLRKEAAKGESPPVPVPRLPALEKQSNPQRSTTSSGTTGTAPSVYNFRHTPKLVPVTSPASLAQHNPAASRIPLTPSGTYAHAHGSMTAPRFGAGQRADSLGQVKTIAERVESGEVPTTATKGSIPLPSGRPRVSPLWTHPESEARVTRRSTRQSKAPASTSSPLARPSPDYPPTGGSPPKLSDLMEGSGKVKNLPRQWLETSSPPTPSPPARNMHPTLTPNRQATPPSHPPPNWMPEFEERLESINMSLDKPSTPEMQDLDTATNAQIVDMILAIQQKADSGINSLTCELKQLSQWIKSHLNNQMTTLLELQRAYAECDSRQREMSHNMRKLKQDMEVRMGVIDHRLESIEGRLGEGAGQCFNPVETKRDKGEDQHLKLVDMEVKMGVIDQPLERIDNRFAEGTEQRFNPVERKRDEGEDQHLSIVNNKRWDDLDSEIHKIALSMQVSTQRTEDAIQRCNAGSEQAATWIKNQDAHIIQMEEEIADLQKTQANEPRLLPSPTISSPAVPSPTIASPGPGQRFVSGSTTASTEPLIKQPESPLPPMRISPLPRSVTAIPTRQRETRQRDMPPPPTPQSSSVIPRSLSMKRGLAKIDSNGPDSQGRLGERVESAEYSKSKVGGTDESKKWNIFGFRRRETKIDDPDKGSSKLSWLPRRSRDGRPSDNASSLSVTPPPPLPFDILQNIENNIQAASRTHPAFRNKIQQAVMHDDSLSIPSTPSTTNVSARMDTQRMGVITASVAPSLASSFENQMASGEELRSPASSSYDRRADSRLLD